MLVVTKTELLNKLTKEQLVEVAKTKRIEVPKRATKSKYIESLLKLSMREIRRIVEDYTEEPFVKRKPSKKQVRRKSTYEKGLNLEKRVSRWLRRAYGFTCKNREHVRGMSVKRGYEVDVHAWIEKGRIRKKRIDIWVECKAFKVHRDVVSSFVGKAEDLRDATDEGIEDWYPDLLMIVSNVGFDSDAVGWADRRGIYCVVAEERSFRFVGDMTREDFEKLEPSDY